MDYHNSDSAFDAIWERRVPFFVVFFVILFVSYGILYAIDFIPEAPGDAISATTAVVAESVETIPEPEPIKEVFVPSDATPNTIIIDKLDREVKVLNPESSSISVLDQALNSGAVRHPQSADFLNDGTMFLFAHSSYLPNVINKNYQAFNGLQDLTWGDKIRVQSDDAEYVYRVDRVYQVKATQAEVAIQHGEPKLTLSTCNSFGSKDDRYIVESTLIETKPLNS